LKRFFKSAGFYFLIVILILFLAQNYLLNQKPTQKLTLNKFIAQVEAGKVKEVKILDKDHIIKGKLQNGTQFEVSYPESYNISEVLLKHKVSTQVDPQKEAVWWLILSNLLPFILILAIWVFMLQQMQGGGSKVMSFGKARARKMTKDTPKVTFKDVAGLDEAVEELQEIKEFLANPGKFRALGAKIPKGLLLYGPPGAGKTLLARAVAGEAGVPFFSISGSDFVEMFVGVGASVSGDTLVLIKTDNYTKLMPISEFVDQYYEEGQEGFIVSVKDVKTLGYEAKNCISSKSEKKFFGRSDWKEVKGVFRHKVDKIYEIHYLGGAIKATGDHSIFVRDKNRIIPKKVTELKPGDILVNLPLKVRGEYSPEYGTLHFMRAHSFPTEVSLKLDIWGDRYQEMERKYEFALENQGLLSQCAIANTIGVSQATVGDWQRGESQPRLISQKTFKRIPFEVKVTPELMKLLGYYTAEGRGTFHCLEFVFGAREKELQKDCMRLMREAFGLDSVIEHTEDNTVRIKYFSTLLVRFFTEHCGNGSRNKHIPEFMWDMPPEYFLSYLEGYSKGDGYITKEGKVSVTSVSRKLITELTWLCAMHGIKVGVRKCFQKGGRFIKDRPLPDSEAWNLIIGKSSNPFEDQIEFPNQIKKPYIKEIIEKPYNGYVYDLCGCENEAFFGGEKPVLLHNSRVRDLFSQAKTSAPCIVFLDEIDAVGRHRGAGLGGGHDEREQTLNQLLVEMDGFDIRDNVILIAATNRPDILDPALLRPGRFDRQVVVDRPDLKGRVGILNVHTRDKPLSKDVDLEVLARRTPGFTGADLANLVNEAALLAARHGKKYIDMEELEEAIDRVIAGPERRTKLISDKEKGIIAYHEAGHALVAHILPNTNPVHKISIIPRGRALGYTLTLPTEDRYLVTKSELTDELAMLLGGRVAEEMIFHDITTGAQDDLEKTTKIARQMVCEYGMSQKLGPLTLGQKQDQVFLGRDFASHPDYSQEVAYEIDKEIKRIVDEAWTKARTILQENREKLDKIANTLIERETLEKEELVRLLEGVEEPVPQTEQTVEEQKSESVRAERRESGLKKVPGKLRPVES